MPRDQDSAPVKIKVGAESSLVKILQRHHEDYAELSDLWAKYQAVYTGGDDMKAHLVRHDREHQDSFIARRRRSFYFNYVKQIINLFVAYLFRKEVSRVSDIPDITAFWSNADGSSEGIEHPIGNILKQAATFYLLFGKVAIVVDMPSTEEEVQSEQDRKDQKLNPYIYLVKPQNIIDWQYGEDGSLDWIRFEESVPVPIDPLAPRSEAKRWKYTTWTRDTWTFHFVEKNKSGTCELLADKTEEGSHSLGRVPVIIVMREDSFKFGSSSGESLIKDIAISNIALYNLSSITGEEFYNHALNILVMQRQSGEEGQGDIVLSKDNVLEYDIGAQAPHFLAASSVPVESLQSFMMKLVDEMKRMSRLGSTDSTLTGTGNQTSGLAHAFSFSDSNQALADTAQLFEEVETRIVTLVSLWLGKDPIKDLGETVVEYPSDFGLSLFDDELSTVENAVQVVPSKTFAKVILKRVAKKFMDKETTELVASVAEEIDLAVEARTNQPEGGAPPKSASSSSRGRKSQVEGSSDDKSSGGNPPSGGSDGSRTNSSSS